MHVAVRADVGPCSRGCHRTSAAWAWVASQAESCHSVVLHGAMRAQARRLVSDKGLAEETGRTGADAHRACVRMALHAVHHVAAYRMGPLVATALEAPRGHTERGRGGGEVEEGQSRAQHAAGRTRVQDEANNSGCGDAWVPGAGVEALQGSTVLVAEHAHASVLV
jgi:hypothetical protein